jgi:dienelactone hydrolase
MSRPRAGTGAFTLLCLLALASCSAAGPRAPASSAKQTFSFAQLEGVYREADRAYAVTYQGWWLDLQTQQVRQLTAAGGGDFTYGPGFQIAAPVQGRLRFAARGEVMSVVGTAPGSIAVLATRETTSSRDVRFASEGATIAATLTIPPGPGPHPGLVILQGSGALDRHFESISQEIYLSLGFAVLAFDKRGVGASTGSYVGDLATPDSIAIQAEDASAAARFLMAQPGVDARRVGFDGNSQGGWVAPLATQQTPGVDFEILVGAPAVSSVQQQVYADFSGGSAYVPTESDSAIDVAVLAASGGYDPGPALAALDVPTLWIYGALDRQVPVRVCLARLATFHNSLWTIDVLPSGNHGTLVTAHGLDSEVPQATRFAGDYFAAVRAWVDRYVGAP